MKIQVEVEIPDGEYCQDDLGECIYLNWEYQELYKKFNCFLFKSDIYYKNKSPVKCDRCKRQKEIV